MINIKNKHKLLAVLIIILIIAALFIVNSIVNKNIKENNGNQQIPLTSEALKQIIPAKIDSILYTFGIKKEWIKNVNPGADSLKKSKEKPDPRYANSWLIKKVQIPTDLPLSNVNYEVTNFLNSLKLNTLVFEDPRSTELSIEVLDESGDTNNVEAVVKVKYNDTLSRNGSEIALILANTEQYKLADLKKMIESPENFSLVLPIDYKYSDLQSLILESNNDYVLFYTIGQEDDFSADFRDKMPDKEWQSKVKSISIAFPKAAAVVLINPGELYKYEKAIREHFLEYRSDVYRDTIFTDIRNSDLSGGPVDKLYGSILNNSKTGKKYQIYVADFTLSDFEYYTQKISELKKKGHKFVSLSRVLRHLEKEIKDNKTQTDSLSIKNKQQK